MADHTKFHLWLNTAIAAVAFGASGASALFSYWTYNLKGESLGFAVAPTVNCRAEYHELSDAGVIGLCYVVAITNQSDSRTSIISHEAFSSTGSGNTHYSGFTEIESMRGEFVDFPIVLESGEARSYVFRVPIAVPQSVARVIKTLSAQTKVDALALASVRNAVADAGLDFLGTSIDVKKDGQQYLMTWPNNFRQATGFVTFRTGRGNTFVARMTYPPTPSPL
jgi:hypothetical protein